MGRCCGMARGRRDTVIPVDRWQPYRGGWIGRNGLRPWPACRSLAVAASTDRVRFPLGEREQGARKLVRGQVASNGRPAAGLPDDVVGARVFEVERVEGRWQAR